jgi:signal transduction histidine kinase
MTFEAPRQHPYDSSDLKFAEMLAQRAALGIHNARLFRHAQDSLRAREDFLSIVAHEIRTPLTAMRLAVQALRRPGGFAGNLGRALNTIERENRRLSHFVDELLEVGRIQGGCFHFDFKPVDFSSIVREVAADLGPTRSALSIETDNSIVGQWDRLRIRQVVKHLLANAIKFGNGQPVELTLRQRDAWAVLRVLDRGIGIPASSISQIFAPFERAVSLRHHGGLGLGLYIVSTIVKGMGGTVDVVSEEGKGSTFTVRLPTKTSEEPSDEHRP